MFSRLLTLAIFSSFAAVGLALPTDCTLVKSGYLTATVSGVAKSFTKNEYSQISYRSDQQNPVEAEFYHCPWQDEMGSDTLQGIIYIPSSIQCIKVVSTNDETGPYFTQLESCPQSRDYAYRFDYSPNGDIYWIGASDIEGTIQQGGCVWLGYQTRHWGDYDLKQEPFVHGRGNQIAITCGNPTPSKVGAPFKIGPLSS